MDEHKLLMVVEDVPGVRELLELTLRFKSYDVMAAQDGQQALEMLESRHPALIVADILMPRMDGFSLIYHLRKDPRTRDIPVIFLSATYVAPEDKDFATTLGAARFLEKPIDMENFISTVESLLKEPHEVPPPLLKEGEFLDKYRTRLLAKLAQKDQQIERAKRLLQTSPPAERSGLEASLRQAVNDRQGVQVELSNVEQIIQRQNPIP